MREPQGCVRMCILYQWAKVPTSTDVSCYRISTCSGRLKCFVFIGLNGLHLLGRFLRPSNKLYVSVQWVHLRAGLVEAWQCWRISGRRDCSENSQAARTARRPRDASSVGLFKAEKALRVSRKEHWRGISQILTTFLPWPCQGRKLFQRFFPFLPVSGGRYLIKWDLWYNIFKFLSSPWFFISIAHSGLTSDNILEEDGSKTKQNVHCPHEL